MHKTLSISGFDGSGGAGMQADLKTFSAFGCYAMNVLTSIPVQNTQGVRSIYDVPIHCIKEQCHAIFDDIKVDAIKIGMLSDHEVIESIADILVDRSDCPIVLDPVMIAKSGHRLLKKNSIELLKKLLIPISSIITPNIHEACELLNVEINNYQDMERAAYSLLKLGSEAVLLKGGHLDGLLSCDILVTDKSKKWYESVRIKTKNTHGTGCTLSSAIAACLAQNLSLESSVEKAKIYVTRALEAAKYDNIGLGCGPLHHFYHLWPSLMDI